MTTEVTTVITNFVVAFIIAVGTIIMGAEAVIVHQRRDQTRLLL